MSNSISNLSVFVGTVPRLQRQVRISSYFGVFYDGPGRGRITETNKACREEHQ